MNYKTIITNDKTTSQLIIAEKEAFGDSSYYLYDEIDLPVVGRKYFVYMSDYVGPNSCCNDCNEILKWTSEEEYINEGMGGNSNNTIKRFHGWRGTNDDISFHALGVRVCTKANTKDFFKTTHFFIEFGPDLVIGQE